MTVTDTTAHRRLSQAQQLAALSFSGRTPIAEEQLVQDIDTHQAFCHILRDVAETRDGYTGYLICTGTDLGETEPEMWHRRLPVEMERNDDYWFECDHCGHRFELVAF